MLLCVLAAGELNNLVNTGSNSTFLHWTHQLTIEIQKLTNIRNSAAPSTGGHRGSLGGSAAGSVVLPSAHSSSSGRISMPGGIGSGNMFVGGAPSPSLAISSGLDAPISSSGAPPVDADRLREGMTFWSSNFDTSLEVSRDEVMSALDGHLRQRLSNELIEVVSVILDW